MAYRRAGDRVDARAARPVSGSDRLRHRNRLRAWRIHHGQDRSRPAMYHADMSVADEVRKAADLGYEYLELSPRADFFFWHRYPKAATPPNCRGEEGVPGNRGEDSDTGAGVQLVVRLTSRNGRPRCATGSGCWRSPHDLECPIVNSELSGDPNDPVALRARVLPRRCRNSSPIFEKYGIGLNLEAHPYDFAETQRRRHADHPRPEPAVGELRVLRSARLSPLRRGGRHAGG